MIVRDYYLNKDELTMLSTDLSLKMALNIITDGNFLSLPVVDNGEFKGFLAKESIFRHYFDLDYDNKEKYLNDFTVGDIYRRDIPFIGIDESIEKAAIQLLKLGAPFLVVDYRGEFMGILTHTAIFEAFKIISGNEKGSKLIVNIENIPGEIAKISDIIFSCGINIRNMIATSPDNMELMTLVIRIDSNESDILKEKFNSLGYEVEMID